MNTAMYHYGNVIAQIGQRIDLAIKRDSIQPPLIIVENFPPGSLSPFPTPTLLSDTPLLYQ